METVQRKISIKEAVQEAKMLGINRPELNAYMKVWAKRAEEKIGSYNQYVERIMVLKPNGCTVQIPCEVVAVLGVLPGDHGLNCKSSFRNLYARMPSSEGTSSHKFSIMYLDLVNYSNPVKYQLENDTIVFNQRITTPEVTVSTLQFQTDEDGWMMVNKNHLTAISAYIQWQYKMWAKNSKVMNYTRGEISDAASWWNMECSNARAEDGSITDAEQSKLTAMYNDPYSGIQNAAWGYNDGYHYGIRTRF